MNIDLNSDVGESFGVYTLGSDAELIPHLSSANIACGLHAGDPDVMRATVTLARSHGVQIGAHPGYADLAGFGRRVMQQTESEIENLVTFQIGALYGFARSQNAPLRHVKPHGALYNLGAKDAKVARAIARAIARFDSHLILVGLANSELIKAAEEFGLQAAREGFCDRAYLPDGSLMSRLESGAVLASPHRAAARAVQIAREGTVMTVSGKSIPLQVDTLCIHGDTPHAVEIARAVREALVAADVTVSPMLSPST